MHNKYAGCGGNLLTDNMARGSCVLSTPFQPGAWLVPNSSPESLRHVPAEHWWQASGSVPAQLGCLIQAGLSEYTAAGQCSAAPRAGAGTKRPQEIECNFRQAFHVPCSTEPSKEVYPGKALFNRGPAKPSHPCPTSHTTQKRLCSLNGL